ncbi:MAG TPA: hypothetical protein DD670_14050, partial [Planctomycetaceae bacterium]|nr:hypothetical protein [Planctomycetaceae bacterium]
VARRFGEMGKIERSQETRSSQFRPPWRSHTTRMTEKSRHFAYSSFRPGEAVESSRNNRPFPEDDEGQGTPRLAAGRCVVESWQIASQDDSRASG